MSIYRAFDIPAESKPILTKCTCVLCMTVTCQVLQTWLVENMISYRYRRHYADMYGVKRSFRGKSHQYDMQKNDAIKTLTFIVKHSNKH